VDAACEVVVITFADHVGASIALLIAALAIGLLLAAFEAIGKPRPTRR
jgi:hypothetical protein